MDSKSEIKTADDLEVQFSSFISTRLSELRKNVAGEFVRIVGGSDWVQIAFIRYDDKDLIRIEVEVSLPSTSDKESPRDASEKIKLLDGMVIHLQYIKSLMAIGFDLSIIREDCLWVASYLTHEKPPVDVFRVIVPPT
jgi:hypothetical protein